MTDKSLLPDFQQFIQFLIQNQFFDKQSIEELINNVNENETKLYRIIEDIESRDRDVIDRFAILLRQTDIVKELVSIEDFPDGVLGGVAHRVCARLKDILHSPKAVGEVLIVKSAHKIKSNKKGDIYQMTAKPRGFCVIIDNHKFTDTTLAFRSGSRADADRLQDVFTQLGFSVFRYNNKTASEVKIIFNTFATKPELSSHDALAVIFLSHGIRDEIYGSDGILVSVDSILETFNNLNCPLMIEKPKLFFLNACRGDIVDPGTQVPRIGYHLSSLSRVSHDSLSAQSFMPRTIPIWSDVFVYFSSISGYASLRNINTGSWFGYELAHALAEHSHEEHLHDLVTIKVGHRLEERGNEGAGRQAIETTTKGRVKKLYFNPGL